MENKQMTKTGAFFKKIGYSINKHTPEILIVSGVAGFMYSTYLACTATTKVSKILEDAQKQLEAVDEVLDSPVYTDDEYTQEDAENDKKIIKTKTIMSVVKLYAPAVIVGTLSAVAIFSSNNIMRKRNLGLAAAYATLDTGFREYRARVVEKYGEDADKELRYNIQQVKISEKITDENGKKKTIHRTVTVADPNLNSMYAVYFDESNPYWSEDDEKNHLQLRALQNQADWILKSTGVLLLNDVYKLLKYPQTIAGRHVGWVMPKDNNSEDDGYVDFGIMDILRDTGNPDNPYKESILLDFNVRQIEDEEYIKLINGAA